MTWIPNQLQNWQKKRVSTFYKLSVIQDGIFMCPAQEEDGNFAVNICEAECQSDHTIVERWAAVKPNNIVLFFFFFDIQKRF